jgi:hypothetical protein
VSTIGVLVFGCSYCFPRNFPTRKLWSRQILLGLFVVDKKTPNDNDENKNKEVFYPQKVISFPLHSNFDASFCFVILF